MGAIIVTFHGKRGCSTVLAASYREIETALMTKLFFSYIISNINKLKMTIWTYLPKQQVFARSNDFEIGKFFFLPKTRAESNFEDAY